MVSAVSSIDNSHEDDYFRNATVSFHRTFLSQDGVAGQGTWYIIVQALNIYSSMVVPEARFLFVTWHPFRVKEVPRQSIAFFGRGRRPDGLSAWAQGRHANTWLAALSAPQGSTLSGTVCPTPLTPGGPVWVLRDKFRCLI